MKTQFENISPDANSSFRLLRNPQLNDVFYWHFHPEFELVFIENADGVRHVGEHISQYEGSDLVLIGSNIPHLNFDYNVKTDCEKVVLHIQPEFYQKVIKDVPEFSRIKALFQEASQGVAFGGETKKRVGKQLKNFHTLNSFEQFITAMRIFKLLAESGDKEFLHKEPYQNFYNQKEQERLRTIYAYVDEHYRGKIELAKIAELCNLSKEAFCRYFKKATGNTFIGFLNQYRISQAKRILMTGKNVSEACYECGFGSLSYFNRTFKKITNENPKEFKKRH